MGNTEGRYEVTHGGQMHSLPQSDLANRENAETLDYPPPYGSPSQPGHLTSNSADVIDVEIRGDIDAPGGYSSYCLRYVESSGLIIMLVITGH